ncbi:hypothetical protein ACIBSV_43165 [Embleya sp. NPDC050154]|uniref:aromatic-ring hydroxylase C-terminal domain-containing protein n=1 Tax=unclassified Embleya TaxID=2699296 RepID=UPI0037A25851
MSCTATTCPATAPWSAAAPPTSNRPTARAWRSTCTTAEPCSSTSATPPNSASPPPIPDRVTIHTTRANTPTAALLIRPDGITARATDTPTTDPTALTDALHHRFGTPPTP